MSTPVEAHVFDCQGQRLTGILHAGRTGVGHGVVLVVGGPQYRIGSHRQFVLLARTLAENGIPVLRFDHRGSGDSEGQRRAFYEISEDIGAAVDFLVSRVPTLRSVTLWGLCDAASAIAMYAPIDPRVTGLVMLNPWVRSEAGQAQAYLRHYYWRRITSREFWTHVFKGKLQVRKRLGEFLGNLRSARRKRPGAGGAGPSQRRVDEGNYIACMRAGLEQFEGRLLLLLSGDDLTAAEFKDLVADSKPWQQIVAAANTTRIDLADANHTFSSAALRDRVAQLTAQWIART